MIYLIAIEKNMQISVDMDIGSCKITTSDNETVEVKGD
jgi:hypothetical protein